jgi:16S rRNA (guanine966-N2)-methyltransferase
LIRIGRGIWHGRILRPDLKEVRPTPARVREALINILYERLQGAVVWDIFSGSGAFGIECLSCGAERAVFLDSSPANLIRIRRFFQEVNCEDKCVTLKGKMPGAFERLVPPVDIVFLDPPYSDAGIYSWIQEFPWSTVVRAGGAVIAESGLNNFNPQWEHRKYGDTHIHILEV